MKEEKGVFNLISFWCFSCLPILLGIGSIFLICNACNDSYKSFIGQWLYWTNSPEKITMLWSLLKVPLGISFLCFPIAGLIAVNHRSKQTALQIIQAKNPDNQKAFYEHKQLFNEFIAGIENTHKISFDNQNLFYEQLFPQNTPHTILNRKSPNDKSSYLYKLKENIGDMSEKERVIQEYEHGAMATLEKYKNTNKDINNEDEFKLFIYKEIIRNISTLLKNLNINNLYTLENFTSGEKTQDKYFLTKYHYGLIDIVNEIRVFCYADKISNYNTGGFFDIEIKTTAKTFQNHPKFGQLTKSLE